MSISIFFTKKYLPLNLIILLNTCINLFCIPYLWSIHNLATRLFCWERPDVAGGLYFMSPNDFFGPFQFLGLYLHWIFSFLVTFFSFSLWVLFDFISALLLLLRTTRKVVLDIVVSEFLTLPQTNYCNFRLCWVHVAQ